MNDKYSIDELIKTFEKHATEFDNLPLDKRFDDFSISRSLLEICKSIKLLQIYEKMNADEIEKIKSLRNLG